MIDADIQQKQEQRRNPEPRIFDAVEIQPAPELMLRHNDRNIIRIDFRADQQPDKREYGGIAEQPYRKIPPARTVRPAPLHIKHRQYNRRRAEDHLLAAWHRRKEKRYNSNRYCCIYSWYPDLL